MKKWWMKGLAVALCAGMLASAAAVSVPEIGMTVYAAKDEAGHFFGIGIAYRKPVDIPIRTSNSTPGVL